MKVALVQMRSSREPARNVKDAEALVREAAATGAAYVLTPEVSNIFEPDKARLRAVIRSEIDDPLVATFSDLAKEFGIHLHAGSVAVKAATWRTKVCPAKPAQVPAPPPPPPPCPTPHKSRETPCAPRQFEVDR